MKTKNRQFRKTYNSTIFSQIYLKNSWGGSKRQFYSGPGSYNRLLGGYVDVVVNFIIDNNIKSIVEIGCGDFNVSSKIIKRLDELSYDYRYIGYDVVKPLINQNENVHGSDRVKFYNKDTCTGILKKGDLLLVRQVLQHLRNKSIHQIVDKFKNYKFILVTEHQPLKGLTIPIIPNLDKKTDANIRMEYGSGVYLEHEPFNCKGLNLMFSMSESSWGLNASINTYLINGDHMG